MRLKMNKTRLFTSVLLIFFFLLFSIACEEETAIVSPNNSQVSNEEPNWLGLPAPRYLRLSKSFSTGALIKKRHGGELIIDDEFESVDGKKVKVIVKLKIYKGSIEKDIYITMAIDGKTGILTFTPHMNFKKDAKLYIKIEGYNFDGVQTKNIDFMYLAKNGYERVEYKKIIVDKSSGTLELKEGKIKHFSRYGFTK